MLPLPRIRLHRPHTVEEALALLERFGRDATLVAGGTDLLPNLKHGLVSQKHIVSLQGVGGLSGIRRVDGSLRIGAMTTLDVIAANALVVEHAPALSQAAAAVGGPHHRRMGTLGGNLCLDTRCRYFNQTYFWRSALGYCLKKDGSVCHVVSGGQKCVAAASNDTATAAIALEGLIHLVGPAGPRRVPVSEFYTSDGIRNSTRTDDEIVIELEIPLATTRRSAYEKLRYRNAIDFPMLSVAARVDMAGEKIAAIDVVVSALAARPRRLAAAKKVAPETSFTRALIADLAQAAHRECHPLENIEGDADWRREMVPVLVRRALERLQAGSHERA